MAHIHLVANSSIEEIKEISFRTSRPRLHHAECVYLNETREKSFGNSVTRMHRSRRRSLPSVSRNEVYRVVPETSKASWRFSRFVGIRDSPFSGKTSEWHAITCAPNDPHRFDAKANKVSGNRRIRVISHLNSHKSAHADVKESRDD